MDLDGLDAAEWGACQKVPYQGESPAKHAASEYNRRRGKGRTRQVPYPCDQCGGGVWHTTTDNPIPAIEKRKRRTIAEWLKGDEAA